MIVFQVQKYTGRKIGKGGFCARVGVQVVAIDAETKKRVYAFGSSPCYKIECGAAHYKGASKDVKARLESAMVKLQSIADRLNRGEITVGEIS